MSTLALIPARGGSTRVKHKNARVLEGHPLMAYTIQAALHALDDARKSGDEVCMSLQGSRQFFECYLKKPISCNTASPYRD